MTQSNDRQRADWNGENGANWVANQARLDAMLAVFGEAAIAAARPTAGERVLDVGCGAGATSLALADRLGADGYVLGVDISDPLIARARALTPTDAPIAYRCADAGVALLSPGMFDLLYSRFGVMFFDDPIAAFAHMRSAIRPGGRLAFICWRGAAENDWVRLPMTAIKGIVPPPAPLAPDAPGPFSFGDRDRIARILAGAGFAEIAITPFDHAITFGRGRTNAEAIDDALRMAFEVGPLTRALTGQPEDACASAVSAVRQAFAARTESEEKTVTVTIDGAAWIVTARNPAGQEPIPDPPLR